MRYSIRTQFAIIFIGMMAAAVGLCWLLNILFLDDYYTREKQKNLIQVYELINQTAMEKGLGAEEFFGITLSNLCSRYNIDGMVVDMASQKIQAFGAGQEESKFQLWDNLIFLDRQKEGYMLETKQYKMAVVTDKRTGTEYLEIWGSLDSADMFLLRTPLEGIWDSAKIANQFLAYIGTGAALASGVVIWRLTKKYTEPIMELVEISERVAHLDFDVKYRRKSGSEIGILGENINHMSAELEKTISELKTANNELKRDIEKKTEMEEIRIEFLSNVSHELKTPIALIQGYAEGIKEGTWESDEERDFYCSVIVDEAQKMDEMVKKLLNLNQLECGSEMVMMERFDLHAMIHSYLQSAEVLARQSGVRVEFSVKGPVYVWADQFRTEEVFANYYTNALNHAEGEDKKVVISLKSSGSLIRIGVFNTGKNIPEDSLSRIWDKFYKVDKARTRAYGGSGVGLSIVKAIMESMNRRFGVENCPEGVLFWFELEQG